MVRKTWRPHPPKRLKHKVPETVKAHVQEKADYLLEDGETIHNVFLIETLRRNQNEN